MSFFKIIWVLILTGIFSFAYADAPVVDYSQPLSSDSARASSPPPQAAAQPQAAPAQQPQFSDQSQNVAVQGQSNLTLEQRVAKLEQQINNLNQQNFSKRLDDLQQQLQQISGNLDVQNHAVQQLDGQVKSFYQDLNQRLQKQETTIKPTLAKGIASAKIANPLSVKAGVTKSAAADSASDSLKEQQIYQDAFNLLQNKKNREATAKFRAYLSSYPNGIYIANAHYWLGEIYFAGKQSKLATSEFETVVNKYSSSAKVPDALFKLYLLYDQAGKHDVAKKELNTLQKRYPHSTAAQLAKQQM